MLFNQQSRFFLTLIQKGNKFTKSNNLIALFVQIPQLMGNEKGNVLCQLMTRSNFSRVAVGHFRESRNCNTSASLQNNLEFVSGGLSKVAQLKPRSS